MADIRRNLAILRADQRREIREKFMELENMGITYDADYLSDYATNSMAKSGEQKMKPNRLQGEGFSYEEARTGKARNGKDLVDRIVFGKNDWGDIIIKDGRHLLEAYRELELPVPARKVKFEDGVQPLELSTDPEIIGDLIVRYRGAKNQDNAYIWAEEELAENFIDYVQGRETFEGNIKQFFDDLLEFIKSLVGAESEIKKLYRELYSGKLSEKQIDNIQKQYIPKYRADLLFDEEEVETEPTKSSEPSKSLEITKTPEKGVVYDTKGTSILPSRKLQQQIEETLMSGQSTPATRSVTAFMPVIETTGKIKDSRAFNKIRDRYEEIQELDPNLNELKYKSMNIADITAKAMAFVDEYPAEARRVALGMELAPEGTTNIAVSLAYTEKMFEEGKWKQAREADRALSIRGTRLGQEIVSFKGRLNANSPMFFVEQVLNARRMVVSSRMLSLKLENFAKMKQKRMAEVAKTLKQIKLEKAEDFINKLIC